MLPSSYFYALFQSPKDPWIPLSNLTVFGGWLGGWLLIINELRTWFSDILDQAEQY